MIALLTASPAACACAHPEASGVHVDECTSHHEAGDVGAIEPGDSIDDSCACAIVQRAPAASSGRQDKELSRADSISVALPGVSGVEFIALAIPEHPAAASRVSHAYSSTLKALLPSRAPPRL